MATRETLVAARPVADEPRDQYRKLSPGPGRLASDVASHQRARIHSAMIEIVAEQGYDAVKVRELVELAGVSSRTFYESFGSKEDCFLRTYELVTRRASRRIIASQAGERDWRKRPRLIFAAFARELEGNPNAARFALIEAHAAGPAALEQARRAERTFEAMLGESFARAPGGVVVPPLVIEGIVGGVAGVTRARLLSGRESELPVLGDELMEWALSYAGKPAAALAALDGQSVWRNTRFEPLVTPGTGDRSALLASVAELAAANGYGKLTVTRIRVHAKVSRKVFDAHFDSVESCFLAALEQKASEALAQAARAQTAARTWPGGIYRGIAALCDQVSEDPFLAAACLAGPLPDNSAGRLTRERLLAATAEQFTAGTPAKLRPSALAVEAVSGAAGTLFLRHIVRGWTQRRQIAATLAFMVLAPMVGDAPAVAAIRSEQTA